MVFSVVVNIHASQIDYYEKQELDVSPLQPLFKSLHLIDVNSKVSSAKLYYVLKFSKYLLASN